MLIVYILINQSTGYSHYFKKLKGNLTFIFEAQTGSGESSTEKERDEHSHNQHHTGTDAASWQGEKAAQ